MRRTLALLLIALTLVPLAALHTEAQEEPQPIIHALREVEIMNAGLLTMNDTFTLEAPPGEQIQITSIKVGFHASFIAERSSFEMWKDESWQPLEHEEVLLDDRFSGYELMLPSPMVLGGGLTLRIRASYLFVNRVSWGAEGFAARIPVYPATPYNISSFILRVTLPDEAELKAVDSPLAFTNSSEGGRWIVRHEAEALKPLPNENVTIVYAPAPEDEYLLDCERLHRSISVLPGRLRLEDTYIITNRGATINRFRLKLPGDASNIRARDGVGPIKVITADKNDAYVEIYVVPRSSVTPWNKWSFTVEYSLPQRGYVVNEGGRFTLTYPAYGFPHYVRNLKVIVTLPEGGNLITSSPAYNSVKKVSAFTQQAIIDFGGMAPYEHPEVVVEYRWSVLWSAFRPLEWGLLAVGVFAGVYLLRRREKAVEKPAEAERSTLEEFLDLYRKRIALLAELDELERGVERKEVGREHFDRRSAEITRRQRDLLRALRRLERRLEASDPRLRDKLREVRDAEAELERVDADLRNLEVRLRTRRVSRRDYERRRRDHLKRRSRARRRIEQAIAALQVEA